MRNCSILSVLWLERCPCSLSLWYNTTRVSTLDNLVEEVSFQSGSFTINPQEKINLSLSVSPINTKHLYNICTTLDQRRRHWANVVQMLYRCFVFAGWYCHTIMATLTHTGCRQLDVAASRKKSRIKLLENDWR